MESRELRKEVLRIARVLVILLGFVIVSFVAVPAAPVALSSLSSSLSLGALTSVIFVAGKPLIEHIGPNELRLHNLHFGYGTLEPEFHPGVGQYILHVPYCGYFSSGYQVLSPLSLDLEAGDADSILQVTANHYETQGKGSLSAIFSRTSGIMQVGFDEISVTVRVYLLILCLLKYLLNSNSTLSLRVLVIVLAYLLFVFLFALSIGWTFQQIFDRDKRRFFLCKRS